ncbi:MAG: CaiB/BaiF CoA transferase family protein [Chloroflexota bacterium]
MTRRPLEGIRVTDFCWVWAGPAGTELLAYLGAEVIRVESQDHMCSTRRRPPRRDAPPPPVNCSTTFNCLNLGKRSITVNLTQPKGIELVKRLVAVSDVVTDNYVGGMMARFGLDYPRLKEVKPDIIVISMSGWGAYGPQHAYRAYDPVFAGLSGFFDMTGYPDGPPGKVGSFGRCDLSCGNSFALSILAALIHRANTGEGQFIDLSQWEVMNCSLGDSYMDYFMNQRSPSRAGNRDSLMAPHNCYRCKGDERWVSIAVASDEEWYALCEAAGRPEWAADLRFSTAENRHRNQQELDGLLGGWTAGYTDYEVTEVLQRAGVAAFPSLARQDLPRDPHLAERHALAEVHHPEAGTGTYLSPPWRMSDTPAEITGHAPLLGQDNEYVFCDLLGMPLEEFALLLGEGIIY